MMGTLVVKMLKEMEFPDLKMLLTQQMQPFVEVLQNGRSWKFCKIHRKIRVPETLFNKVVGLQPATLLQKRL